MEGYLAVAVAAAAAAPAAVEVGVGGSCGSISEDDDIYDIAFLLGFIVIALFSFVYGLR